MSFATPSLRRHLPNRRTLAPASRGVARRACALVLGVAFLAPVAATATAQDSLNARPQLRLGELYRTIDRGNPRIAAAQAMSRAAESRVAGARRPPDPELQLGLMNYVLPAFTATDALSMNQIQLMQTLPVAGQLGLAGRVAGAQATAMGHRADAVRWDVRVRVASVFFDLYQTDHSLTVALATLRLVQDIARNAESMYRVGEGRQADVLRAQVEVARMTEEIERLHAGRRAMEARLNGLLDRQAPTAVGDAALPFFPAELPAADSLEAWALRERPVVRAGAADVAAADQQAILARRSIWPDLRLGVQYGQRSNAMGTDRMASLMVGASIPVFAGSLQLRARDEAGAMQALAHSELSAMRAETRGDLGETLAHLRRARTLRALYRTTVIPQAEAAVASAQSAYRVGTVNFMTLLDNQSMVNRYRQELIALDADEGRAWATLEMLTGRVLFDADRLSPPSEREP